MPGDTKIREFIENAKARGASEQTLVGVLAARGWPEKEVYETLAAHYEGLTGIQIPPRASAATPAKDAFFYLLAFSTLATWTIGLGSLAFSLIDEWLADALFSTAYNQAYETYGIAAAMASILVVFPIYMLMTRTINRDARNHPEKLNSSVRKWLTYMALVIAAGVSSAIWSLRSRTSSAERSPRGFSLRRSPYSFCPVACSSITTSANENPRKWTSREVLAGMPRWVS
jgi:Domain of unknown function (DUF5671)